MNHTAVLGDKVTYACTAKYQGLVTDDAIWSGVGVTKGTRTATSADKVPCENAKPNTCFVGKSTSCTSQCMHDVFAVKPTCSSARLHKSALFQP